MERYYPKVTIHLPERDVELALETVLSLENFESEGGFLDSELDLALNELGYFKMVLLMGYSKKGTEVEKWKKSLAEAVSAASLKAEKEILAELLKQVELKQRTLSSVTVLQRDVDNWINTASDALADRVRSMRDTLIDLQEDLTILKGLYDDVHDRSVELMSMGKRRAQLREGNFVKG